MVVYPAPLLLVLFALLPSPYHGNFNFKVMILNIRDKEIAELASQLEVREEIPAVRVVQYPPHMTSAALAILKTDSTSPDTTMYVPSAMPGAQGACNVH